MGASEEVAPVLAILLEAIADEMKIHQDHLSVRVESKIVRGLLECYRLGADSVYNRPTIETPQPFPAAEQEALRARLKSTPIEDDED